MKMIKANRIVVGILILCFLMANIPVAQESTNSWWNTKWNYRKEIVINYTKVATTLTNFPVLISIPDDKDLALSTQFDGDDIVFTDKNGNKLNHEIELFTKSTGRLIAWVNVPTLSSTSDTLLYLYYGNSACLNQQNSKGTWNSNYLFVHHMEETGNIIDSTSNGLNAVNYGTTTDSNGKIGKCRFFDSKSDRYNFGNPSLLNPGSNSWTIMFWTKITHTNSNIILRKWSSNKGFFLNLYNGWGGTNYFKVGNGVSTTYRYWNKVWSDGSWHHIAIVLNRNTNTLNLYCDGILANGKGPGGSGSTAIFPNIINSENFLLYGGLNGRYDEFTISKTVQSSSWIKTSYNNQNNPTSFYSLSTQKQVPTGVNIPVGSETTVATKVKKMVTAYGSTISDKANREFIASHFDLVNCPFSEYANQIKLLNPKIKIIGYQDAIGMSSSYSDWDYVNKQESWFAHSINGGRIKSSSFGWYLMDPNSGWSDYFAQRCKSLLQKYPSYDGIFVDDMTANLQESGYTFNIAYSNFKSSVLTNWESGALKLMAKTKAAVGNKIVMTNAWKYMQFCEKATQATHWEGFIHSRSSAYNNKGYGLSYEYGLLAIKYLNQQAKLGNIIAVNSGCKDADSYKTASRAWQRFTLGCFLMAAVNLDKAYYSWQFINTDSSKGYFTEMDYNIGSPISEYKNLVSKTYIREFRNYYVVVNLDLSFSSSFSVNGVKYSLQPRDALFIKK